MFYGKKLCGIITRPASCPASWALLLLAAVTALGLLSQGAAWAKGTQELIVEQAARLNIELNEQEAAVLRRTLPIIGRRYLREMDSTPLLKATMEGLKEYDAALAGIKKTAKDEDAEAPEVTHNNQEEITC